MLSWWGGHRELQSRESLGVRKEGSTPAPGELREAPYPRRASVSSTAKQ